MHRMVPETRYAKTADGVHIAYQLFGDGACDLCSPIWASNVDAFWGWEPHASSLRRLASFARVLAFDRRGTGASDHIADRSRQQSLEARMDDIRAVMDAARSERAVVVGIEDGFSLAAMFAATYPERTLALMAGRRRRGACGRQTTRGPSRAEFVELPGRTHGWVESPELIDEIERFVGDLQREEAAFDRVLATVPFTDIVASTEKAAGC
jgi:hypothetical protein